MATAHDANASDAGGDDRKGSGVNLSKAVRQLMHKFTGREQPKLQSAQLVDMALERAMRQLIDRGLVEVAARQRDRLIEQMLAATFRARGLESAVDLALEALLQSEIPEEIYGEDRELRSILLDAFESVQRTS